MTLDRSRLWPLLVALIGVALLAAACSDSANKKVAVTAADYSFTGMPATVRPGTVFTLTNTSTKEIHELVAVRLPDSERRPVEELVRLPQDQFGALSPGPPAAVLIAPPGGAPGIKAVGDGSLKERGRYIVACFVPTGADPAAVLNAMREAQSTGGPPQRVAGGPPHLTQGMYTQVVVK